MKIDRHTLFNKYREAFGPIQQLQVEGLEFLLGAIESDPKWKSLPQIAYFLATIKHETGVTRGGVLQTFTPIKEVRGRPGTKIRAVQDKYWGTGFFGRGYCQLTHRANYMKFGIEDTPEKALEPETAYMIAARGMRGGLFTGKKLSDFINESEIDYTNARKVVNGLDRANDIAFIAEKFERILRASVKEAAVIAEEKKEPETSVTESVTETDSLPTQPPTPQPEGITVQKVVQSLGSKVMAGGTVVMGALTAIGGAFLGVLKNPYAFAILIVGCAALGVYAWNKSKDRQLQLQLDLNAKAADKDQHTVVLAPSAPPKENEAETT